MQIFVNRPLALLGACVLFGLTQLAPLDAQTTRTTPTLEARYQEAASRIISAALADSAPFARLTELSDRFGHRFSGSESLELALDWIFEGMRTDGLENVRNEPVMVPHWVRGEESAALIEPRRKPLPMLGLGGSI